MKPTRPNLLRAATASAMALITAHSLQAAGGSWNVTAGGTTTWSTTSNWTPAAVPGTTAGDVVNFTNNIAAAYTITLDGTRLVGDLNIGDSTATLFGFTLSAGTGSLSLDGTGTTAATVDFTAAIANTISAPITLVDNAVFRSNVNAVMTLSGIISGVGKTVTYNNDTNGATNAAVALQGQFSVTGANTYTGGTSISDVRVSVATSASALGTGNVTISSGGQVFCASALTLANTFSIAGNGWAETTAGNPLGALRLEGNAIVSGAVTMTADAAIGSNTGTATVSGNISGGSFGLSKRGPGTIVLSGTNTFSGLTISSGIIQLNNNNAAGSGPIALSTGGVTNTRLAVNAGVTIANNVTIPTTTNASGRGNIEYAGTIGVAQLNGTITITGGPSLGGHIYGGPSAANVLHFAGPINATVPFSQRDRFVKFSGGGTSNTNFTVTGTVIVGATNGLPTGLNVILGGSLAANLDLNGFNQSLAGLSRNANVCVVGNSSTTADSTLTITGTSAYSGNITDVIAPGTRKVLLTVAGGNLTLSGTNTQTGATSVTSGSLAVTATSAVAPSSVLSVSSGAKFSYQPTVAGPLTMGTAGNTFATGSTLGAALGGTVGQSVINFPGSVSTAGTITLDLWAVPGVAIDAGTHTLVTATGGLSGATYALGNFYNASDYTIGNLTVSDTAITVDVTPATPLATAYWKGGLVGVPSVWNASNGSTQSNWVASSGGANQPLVPGAGADVVFSNSTVTTAPTAVTLASSAAVKSLTISDTVNGLGLTAVTGNTSTLTLGTGGLTMASGVPASTISVPVIATADQTWTNNSANALTVNSSLAGTTFGLTKAGTGPIALTAPTYSGATNVNAGTLTLTGGALSNSAVTVASGATLTASSVISGTGSLSNSGTATISGANTYTGATDALAGSLTMSGGTLTASALTVASGATFNQTAGVISGTGAFTTSGTTTLAGTNTFSSDITLSGGVLQVGLGNGITGNLGSVTTPASFSKYINFTNNATLRNTTTFNNNVGSATVLQLVFNFGTGGGTLDTPTGTTLTLDDGAIVGNANNAAQLQGSGNLTKIGVGTLSLGNGTSNYSAFTGQIFVNEGTLTTGAVSTNPFGDTAAGTTIAAGAVLDVKGVSIGAEPLTLNGLGLASAPAGALISSTGTGGIATGPVTIASDSSFGGAGTLTLTGALTGTGGLSKVGAGSAVLSGDVSGFSGAFSLTAGTLTVPDTMSVGALAISGGSLFGEITSTSFVADGGTIYFDPNSADKLTTGALTVNGPVTLDVTSLAPANTTVTAISATSLSGAGSFSIANAANYRTPPTVNATNSGVTVSFAAGKTLTWTGSASGVWNLNSALNWDDGVGSDVFFSGDSVTLPEGGSNPAITLTGLISPAGLAVNANTTAYTLTSTAGNQLTGGTGLTKTAGSTLTLVGPNTYNGVTTIAGGVLNYNGTTSLGSGNLGNSIVLSGGGKLSDTATAALDLGANRDIAVGLGGGTLAHNSGTGTTTTVSGDISGSNALGFLAEGAGTGTYSLTGNNSGYTGAISITSVGAGVATVTLANQAAVPTSGSITINHPGGAAVSTNNTLTLSGVSIPAGVTIFTTAGLNSVPVLTRSQITSSGSASINGPIKASSVTSASLTQVSPGAGSTLTLNGNVSETSPGSFISGSVFFLRGTGNIVVNGTINLPTGNVIRTDAGTVTFNSTGNTWASTAFSVGTAVLGINDALPATAPLNLGQNDGNAVTFNLAGFNQTVAGLTSNPIVVGANTTGKSITSATTATLTSTPVADVTYAGLITGAVSLAKGGAFTQTLLGANTFTGDIAVNGGKLTAGVAGFGASSNTRTITVASGAVLEFGAGNIFGNHTNINVPDIIVNGGTVTNADLANSIAPNRKVNNALRNLTLNSGTLTATKGNEDSTDIRVGEGYGTWGLNGTVTSTGTSLIDTSAVTGKAGRVLLSSSTADTFFNVVSGTLTVSAPLQTGESTPNYGLTKTGTGTLVLSGANIYSVGTTISAGTVKLGSSTALGTGPVAVSAGAVLDLGNQAVTNVLTLADNAILVGTGGIFAAADTVSGTVSPGNSAGTVTFSNTTLTFGPTAELNLEIGGTAPGSFDVVGSNGVITFASGCVIKVTLIGGFAPVAGNSFDLISEDGSITSAATLDLPALSGGLVWNTSAFGTTGTISVASGDPVAAYAGTFGLTGNNTLADADPDRDGISNALEYAFGINPTANNGPEYRGIASLTSGALSLTYRRPSTLPSGLTASSYVVQINTVGLVGTSNWVNATAGVDYTQIVTPLGGGVDAITINFTGAVSGKKFARILVNY